MTTFETIRTVSASERGHPYKAVECRDGFSLSVQAHRGGYSTPRSDTGPYTAFEVMIYTDNRPPEMEAWYSEFDDLYAWVPARIVEAVIASHGGEVAE